MKRLLTILFILFTVTQVYADSYKYNPFTGRMDIVVDKLSEMSIDGDLDLQGYGLTASYVTASTVTASNVVIQNDEAYGTNWNDSLQAPTKNAVYDKVESLAGGHDAVTVTDSTTIDFTLTGQDITASVKTDSINDTHIDWGLGANQVNSDDIPLSVVGTPTYDSVNDFMNSFGSTGRKTGGIITDGGSSNITVTGGTGFIKATDDDNAQLLSFDFPANTDIAIPSGTTRYIGVEYNSGTPQIVARTSFNWNLDSEFSLGRVINENINGADSLHIINNPWWVTDGITNVIERFRGFGRITRDEYVGGLALSVPGTRNIAVTAGKLWSNFNEFDIDALDTSSSGTFCYYWYKSGTGWQTSDATQYSVTQWNDITQTTLQTISNNKYCNVWVYVEADEECITVLYPQAQYNTAAAAEAVTSPTSIPNHVSQNGILIGRIIIKQGTDTPIAVQSAFTTKFSASVATNHNNLAGLQGGTTNEYYHATSSEYTELNRWIDDISLNADGSIDYASTVTVGGASHTFVYAGTTYTPKILSIRDNSLAFLNYAGTYYSNSNSQADQPIIVLGRGRGTNSSKSTVVNDDYLGELIFAAWNGTDWSLAARIISQVNGAVGDGDMPGSLLFQTTADGSENPTTRLEIDAAGLANFAGDIQVSGGNINTGNIPLVIGDGTTDSVTITTDGTGNGEVVLPNDSIGPDELDSTTGAYDFGGVTSFEVPNGANPTVDAGGELSVDTSAGAGSMIRFYGNAEYALPAYQSKSFTIMNITANDDIVLWRTPQAITIRNIHVQVLGGTSVTGGLDECDSNGINALPIDSDITCNAYTNTNDDGTISNPTLDSGDYLFWHTTSVSGSASCTTVTWDYTIDPVN